MSAHQVDSNAHPQLDDRYWRKNLHRETSSGSSDAGFPVKLDSSGKLDTTLLSDIDHGELTGLSDDDHAQYHNDNRGDIRYYQKNEFTASSSGIGDADKPVKLSASGVLDSTLLPGGALTDHGVLGGLSDDDHTQYHNNTRGDERYFQKTEFLEESSGAADAGSPIKLDSLGQIDLSMVKSTSKAVTMTVDGGGSEITTNGVYYIKCPFAGTISGWEITATSTGEITFDVWKDSFNNFPPTLADSITGSEPPILTQQMRNSNYTIASWNTNINEGDWFAFTPTAVSGISLTVVALLVDATS